MRRYGMLLGGAALWLLLPGVPVALQPDPSRPRSLAQSPAEDEETQRMLRQAAALGIPKRDLDDLVKGCRGAGFTSSEVRRVLSLMTRAKLAGLPHGDLLNKLREGLAKKARPEVIEKAVETKAQSLRAAKSLVDSLLAEGHVAPDYSLAVQVVADALEGGAGPADVLRAVREGRPPGNGVPDVRRAFRGNGK